MPSDLPSTPEFDARAEWCWRVLGIRLTEQDQANAVSVEALVTRYEELDAAQGKLVKLLSGEMKSWPGAAGIDVAPIEKQLAGIERDLTHIDAEVIVKEKGFQIRLDNVGRWQQATSFKIANAIQRRDTAVSGAKSLRQDIAKTVSTHEGDVKNSLETLDKDAGGIAGLAIGWDLDAAEQALTTCRERLVQIQKAISIRFDKVQEELGQERLRLNALKPLSEDEGEQSLDKLDEAIETALNGTTPHLVAAEQAILEFRKAIDAIDVDRKKSAEVKQDYDELKPVLERIAKLSGKDFTQPTNAKAVTQIQTRIVEDLSSLEEDAESHGWGYVEGDVEKLRKLLEQAKEILESDNEAARIIAEEERAAAEAVRNAALEEQRRKARVEREARQRFEENVELAKRQGDEEFTAPDLVKKVWSKTKEDAPYSQNSSVGGAYTYDEIMDAIEAWHRRNLADGYVTLHVPGGGSIQDKRPKGRDEVQGNFISDWGPGGRVNVHVNLRRDEWDKVA
jgi:hypothetical protein